MKINSSLVGIILFTASSVLSCQTRPSPEKSVRIPLAVDSTSIMTASPVTGKGNNWSLRDFYRSDPGLENYTDSIYENMNDGTKAAQMIMSATSEYPKIGVKFSEIMTLYNQGIIGGVVFLKGREEQFSKEMVSLNENGKIKKMAPLIFSCDCEPTLFHKKFTDQDSLLPANLILSDNQSDSIAKIISKNMLQHGFQWNFAPVADVSENKEIIDKRSFGSNPREVISKSVAFVIASRNESIATTLKHFPGHGAVKGDSHHELVFIDSSLTELNNFKEIIDKSSPIGIMVGHIAIKNNPILSTDGFPSTLSKKIITGLLKDSLGFKGIVITDAMNMGAVKNIPNADYLAVLAGNDIILFPKNPKLLHKQIMNQLHSQGKLKNDLKISIKKIIRLKVCLNIIK